MEHVDQNAITVGLRDVTPWVTLKVTWSELSTFGAACSTEGSTFFTALHAPNVILTSDADKPDQESKRKVCHEQFNLRCRCQRDE